VNSLKETVPGILIALEGIDGAGKSTLAQKLVAQLCAQGKTVLLTKEPGGSNLGIHLRSLLAQERGLSLDPKAEYLLFAADRAQHIAQVIRPALAAGTIVITDRFTDSSIVYQGYGRGLDKDMIKTINSWCCEKTSPTLTFYLAIDAQTAQSRWIKRNEKLSRFETEGAAFLEKLIAGFTELYHDRDDVVHLDALLSPDELITHVRSTLKERLILV
jgi:dTMP kinase